MYFPLNTLEYYGKMTSTIRMAVQLKLRYEYSDIDKRK